MTTFERQLNGSSGATQSEDDDGEVPYVSLPIEASQPACLAAIARLHGLTPAAPDKASVLELGCGSGGNIIPLAARFPGAKFAGIDLAASHVARAQARIAALGLKNIIIRQGDVASLDLSALTLDYIICHGVFSWVEPATQDAILRICGQHLKPHGIVYMSYNVLPGWHQRNIVRDICLEHARPEKSAAGRVAKSREILSEIAKSVSTTNPYGVMLHNEVANLKTLPASYLLGEFLAAENNPCTFRQFSERAHTFGLSYLSECDMASSSPETMHTSAAQTIRRLAGPDPISVQNYTDIFSGRMFRRSLLVRSSEARAVKAPEANRLGGLHLACPLRKSRRATEPGVFDRFKRPVIAQNAATQEALAKLSQRYPSSVPFDDLNRQASTLEAQAELVSVIYKLVSEGAATLYALPLRCGTAQTDRPEVWPLARLEAKSGQTWVTSLNHRSIPLNKILAFLVPRMDGATDKMSLQRALSRDELSATAPPPAVLAQTGSAPGTDPHDALAADYLRRGLDYLAANALLVPA